MGIHLTRWADLSLRNRRSAAFSAVAGGVEDVRGRVNFNLDARVSILLIYY